MGGASHRRDHAVDVLVLSDERGDSLTACYPAISKHRSGEPEVSINPRRIQSALAPGEVLLDYVISGAYMYTLACTCDTCVIYQSPEAEKCLEEFSDSENALNSADLERFIPMARKLSEKLFGPASELWRGASRLIIIPDPAFGSLPFECLTVPGMQEHGPAPYMVSRFSVSYQCSLRRFLTSRLKAPGMKGKQYSWFGCAPTFDSREGLADLLHRDDVIAQGLFAHALNPLS